VWWGEVCVCRKLKKERKETNRETHIARERERWKPKRRKEVPSVKGDASLFGDQLPTDVHESE
jgi:hypothetical protein